MLQKLMRDLVELLVVKGVKRLIEESPRKTVFFCFCDCFCTVQTQSYQSDHWCNRHLQKKRPVFLKNFAVHRMETYPVKLLKISLLIFIVFKYAVTSEMTSVSVHLMHLHNL